MPGASAAGRLAVVSGHVGTPVCSAPTAAVEGRRPRVAAIVTAYFPQSHADVIITKLIKGYSTDDGFVLPSVDVVSLYMDQCIQPPFDDTLPLDKQPGALATPGGRNPRDIGAPHTRVFLSSQFNRTDLFIISPRISPVISTTQI